MYVNSFPLPTNELHGHSRRGLPESHLSSTAEDIGVGTGYLYRSVTCPNSSHDSIDILVDEVPFPGELDTSSGRSSFGYSLPPNEVRTSRRHSRESTRSWVIYIMSGIRRLRAVSSISTGTSVEVRCSLLKGTRKPVVRIQAM